MEAGARAGGRKLHLGVDPTGVIVAHALTDATVDDATTGVELIEAVNGPLTRVTADGAYDTVAFYDAAGARGRESRGAACASRIPNSLAESGAKATLRAADHVTYAVARMEVVLLTLLHLAVTAARLCRPGGVRAVIAENLLLKQQLIVLRRPRKAGAELDHD